MHLYPPDVTWWEDTRAVTGPRHTAYMLFTGGEQAGLQRLLQPQRQLARFTDETGQISEFLFMAARRGQERGEDGFWDAQQALCGLLALLLSAKPDGADSWRIVPTAHPPAEPGLSSKVQEFLRVHLDKKLTLLQIARHLHVSESTLSHTYQKEAAEGPMSTLARLRIERAKSLLVGGFPLKAIAEQVGFSSPFHLSRAFKRIEGQSPKAFKKAGIAYPTAFPASPEDMKR